MEERLTYFTTNTREADPQRSPSGRFPSSQSSPLHDPISAPRARLAIRCALPVPTVVPVFLTRGEASVEVHLAKKQFILTVVKFSARRPEPLSPGIRNDFRPRAPVTAALQRLIDEELPVMTGLPLDEETHSP
jgi:hypothetical protein